MQITKELTKDQIEIKQYIPFIQKQLLVNQIVNMCLEEDHNGLLKCNFFNKKLALDSEVVIMYTNLEFNEENFLEQYDFLVESKLMDYIIGEIDGVEYDTIIDAVFYEIEERQKLGNSIEGVLANKLTVLLNKIPDEKSIKALVKSLVKEVNKLDNSKFGQLKDTFNKVVSKQNN